MTEEKKGRILSIFVRCNDPVKAKQIVLDTYPDAFVQTTRSYAGRIEYTIQRLIKSKADVDGDYREDIGCTSESENQAWLFAADNVLREKEKLQKRVM